MSKVRVAFIEMNVLNFRQRSTELIDLVGPLISSNFLKRRKSPHFSWPIFTVGANEIDIGDRVRLSYFTTDEELKNLEEGRAFGFIDQGLRYERLGRDGWELIYENFSVDA